MYPPIQIEWVLTWSDTFCGNFSSICVILLNDKHTNQPTYLQGENKILLLELIKLVLR